MTSLIILLLCSFTIDEPATIDKEEAQKAFVYLNNIRTHPKQYYKEFPFLQKSTISTKPLVWNDTLARVAEAKAYDMASKNYYDHVDPKGYGINYYINQSGYRLRPEWLKEHKLNYFESIAANALDGENAIQLFIIDKDVPSLGHRKQVLGLDDWHASMTDIGIGFARRPSGGEYETYVCLIMAKHDW